jgi:hypothetical protein
VQTSVNKVFILNLNNYRNAHHFTLNKAKKLFNDEVEPLLQGINKRFKKFELVYTVYKNDERKCDVNNICSIVDKFFCDVLVEKKIIVDDDYKHLPQSTFKWGGVDAENPRVEVEIIEITGGVLNDIIYCTRLFK